MITFKNLALILFIFSVSASGDDNIVEFKDEKSPIVFKYDKREYNTSVRVFNNNDGVQATAGPRNNGKKESICQDKKYNKHFCPRFRFRVIFSDIGIKEYLPAELHSSEDLEWDDPAEKIVSDRIKLIEKTHPAVYEGKNWSQIKEDISCEHSMQGDLVFDGSYSFIKTVYLDEYKIRYTVEVFDSIFNTMKGTGADDTDPEVVARHIESSKFFEKNYCKDNVALKNWDIGNHARMLIDSVRPDMEYLKKLAASNREKAAMKLKEANKNN